MCFQNLYDHFQIFKTITYLCVQLSPDIYQQNNFPYFFQIIIIGLAM
jgi:hypothetical protein